VGAGRLGRLVAVTLPAAGKLARLLERLGTYVVSLSLDPPTPILIYPRTDDPFAGEQEDPLAYPRAIYWGYPPSDRSAYVPGTQFVWSEAAEISHGPGLLNSALSVLPWTNLLGFPVYRLGVGMQWLQTNIHAKLGAKEELVHALKWAPDTGSEVPAQSDAAVLDFATTVSGLWHTFLQAFSIPALGLATTTTYDFVLCAPYEQTVPNVAGQSTKGHTHQLRPTQLAPIGAVATTGAALPYEVAMVVTLRTLSQQTGGPSHGRRNRGRTYLGGFNVAVMATDGLFNTQATNAVEGSFAAFVTAVNAATGYRLAIHSFADLVARPVTKVQVGQVPDSMRSRRRSQLESYPSGAPVTVA